MKKIIVILIIIIAIFKTSRSDNIGEFIGFTKNKKYAFFRIIDNSVGSSAIKYVVYDVKNNKKLKEYSSTKQLKIWNKYFNKISLIYGIQMKKYKGYYVTVNKKYVSLNESEQPMSGLDTGFISAGEKRKLISVYCSFYLHYKKGGIYKRIKLFNYTVTNVKAKPIINFSVWWEKEPSALAVVVNSRTNLYGNYLSKSFFFAISF